MLSVNEINLLQAQNEGLKKQNKELQKENAELKENFGGQRNAYKKLNSMYEENCEYTGKLLQTLQDIKAIAEEDCKQCFEIDGFSKPDDCGICPYNKILQKITKAESEG